MAAGIRWAAGAGDMDFGRQHLAGRHICPGKRACPGIQNIRPQFPGKLPFIVHPLVMDIQHHRQPQAAADRQRLRGVKGFVVILQRHPLLQP
ncbi:hypothetical protein D3C73_1434680 [compost metagenome]